MRKSLLVVLVFLSLATAASASVWCSQCSNSHGHSVSACGMCLVESLFDLLGGW